MARAAWAALPLLLATLAGCGGGAAGGPAPAKTNTVNLPPSYLFSPSVIQVTAGTTVTWTNNDNFSHSVLVNGSNDAKIMKPGEQAQITFSQPGTYDYVCTFHTQNMKGRVIVTSA